MDEGVWCIKNNDVAIKEVTSIIKDSIKKVNKTFLLRREMDCDVQVGERYSDIH